MFWFFGGDSSSNYKNTFKEKQRNKKQEKGQEIAFCKYKPFYGGLYLPIFVEQIKLIFIAY